MSIRLNRKLMLNRETIRKLTTRQLARVQGGAGYSLLDCDEYTTQINGRCSISTFTAPTMQAGTFCGTEVTFECTVNTTTEACP